MRPFRFLPKVLRVLLISNAVVFGLAFVLGKILGLHLNLPGLGYGSIAEYIAYFGMAPLAIFIPVQVAPANLSAAVAVPNVKALSPAMAALK